MLEIKGVDEDGSIEFINNEEKEIEILIPTLKKEDQVKVYVYESNGQERICDTLNFQISVTAPSSSVIQP